MPPQQFKNVVITGGTFISSQPRFTQRGVAYVETLLSTERHIAPGAFHNSSEQYDLPKCHPDTRIAVLNSIMNWIHNPAQDFPFLWLYGPAGTGKSAICRTIAERCYYLKLLLANFCFSRTATDGRNTAARLIATIAYQLALSIPSTRAVIEAVVEDDPSMFDRSIEVQVQRLLVAPIQFAFRDASPDEVDNWPRLVLIDGLDECQNSDIQTYILEVFVGLSQQPDVPIIFLIASRPEYQIRSAFDIGQLNGLSTRLVLDDSFHPDVDIVTFLNSELCKIKNEHPFRSTIPDGWPSHQAIHSLAKKSSGQFIFPATVVKYVKSKRHRPAERLDIMMGLRPSDQESPFAELDALYQHIFSSVLNLARVLRIIGFKLAEMKNNVTFNPPSQSTCTIEQFLLLGDGDLKYDLADLEDILVRINEDGCDIRILHASLGDFLVDPQRSGKCHIDIEKAHTDSAICYLRHLGLITRRKNVRELWRCFCHHLANAFPTEELRFEILQYDVFSSAWSLDLATNVRHGWRFLPEFLDGIRSSKILDADVLSAQIIAQLDDHFRLHLPKYKDVPRLRDLLVFVAVGCDFPPPGASCSTHTWKLDVSWDDFEKELVQMGSFEIDDNSLRLMQFIPKPSTEERFRQSRSFRMTQWQDSLKNTWSLREYLSDPRRSGEFCVDDTDCAAMSLRCLQVFFDWLPSVIQTLKKEHEEKYESQLPVNELPIKLSAQYVTEVILPLIGRASVSKDLESYIRQPHIHSTLKDISRHWICPMVRVNGLEDALQRYLLRCLEADRTSSMPYPLSAGNYFAGMITDCGSENIEIHKLDKGGGIWNELNAPRSQKPQKTTNLGKRRRLALDLEGEIEEDLLDFSAEHARPCIPGPTTSQVSSGHEIVDVALSSPSAAMLIETTEIETIPRGDFAQSS